MRRCRRDPPGSSIRCSSKNQSHAIMKYGKNQKLAKDLLDLASQA